MILGFKQNFKDGSPTWFAAKILKGSKCDLYNDYKRIVKAFDELPFSPPCPKIHSLREGKRWKPGMSIQMAYGVRSRNYYQFNSGATDLTTCKSTQDIFMTYDGYALEITVAHSIYMMPHQIDLLIKNDGLTREQFLGWFFPNKKDEWSGQIIHWTDFKYTK
jgi:hypothetical protein